MKNKLILCLIGALLMSGCTIGKPTEVEENQGVTVYITRHGETEYNVQELAQGWSDSPLTDKGINQAKLLAKELENLRFAKVVSSPSERAVATTELLLENKENREYVIDERFKEMNFGSLEGQPGEELWAKGIDYCFENGWVEYGGEDFVLLAKRSMEALDELVKDPENQRKSILISTHGMTVLSILYEIAPEQADTLEGGVENCSITEIQYNEGKYELVRMNDTSYIK